MIGEAQAVETTPYILKAISEIELFFSGLGIRYSKPSSGAFQRLAELPPEELAKVAERVELIWRSLMELKNEPSAKDGVTREVESLKRILKALNLRPVDDLTNLIQDGDIVEIYDSSGYQLYHNLEWLQYSSYSLLDVMVYPFQELFERPTLVTQQLWEEGKEVYYADSPFTKQMEVPPHTIRERLSPEGRCFLIDFKYITPLLDENGQSKAVLVTQRANRVEQQYAEHLNFI